MSSLRRSGCKFGDCLFKCFDVDTDVSDGLATLKPKVILLLKRVEVAYNTYVSQNNGQYNS